MLNKEDALLLWNSVLYFADGIGELYAEGNSGEFHDDEEEKRLFAEMEQSLTNLMGEFERTTGWMPVYRGDKEDMREILNVKKWGLIPKVGGAS